VRPSERTGAGLALSKRWRARSPYSRARPSGHRGLKESGRHAGAAATRYDKFVDVADVAGVKESGAHTVGQQADGRVLMLRQCNRDLGTSGTLHVRLGHSRGSPRVGKFFDEVDDGGCVGRCRVADSDSHEPLRKAPACHSLRWVSIPARPRRLARIHSFARERPNGGR